MYEVCLAGYILLQSEQYFTASSGK